MAKPTIGLLCDLPENSGIGKYGKNLQRLLKNEFDIEIVYFNYEERSLEAVRGKERRTLAQTYRFPLLDNKPWFWQRVKNHIPRYDLTHIISQNLSFLVPSDGNALVTCHDIAPLFIPSRPWERWGRKRLYSGLQKAKTILTDSESTRQDLIGTYRLASEKLQVIPLGVDRKVFHPIDRNECRTRMGFPLDSRIILNVSIDKWRKNVSGLVKAVALLIKEFPNILLILVGKPTAATSSLIRTLGLDHNVQPRGATTEEDLAILYNVADVLAFPSFYEGFGLPVLEAMACGIPVVASNRTSVPEIVGDAGILLDPEEVLGLAEAIKRVLTEPNFANDLLSRGLDRAKRFSWEKTARATASVYAKILYHGQSKS